MHTTRHLIFLLTLKQLQLDTHTTTQLIPRKVSTRLDDRLETLLHAFSLFLHEVCIDICPDLLDFAFECRNRPGFASLQFRLHVSPHLFNRIQVWRVGGPLTMRAGFDVIWHVLFEPFIRRPCFVWGRTIMYKCPTTIARAKYRIEIRFCFLQKCTILGPRQVVVVG